MKSLTTTFITECIKLRRSKIFVSTLIFFIFIPIMMGLMMIIAQHPEFSAKLGLVGTKAKLFSENNWQGYFTMHYQLIASVGLIGFGFVTAWVFGSEYINHTITNILVLPVSRSAIVISKFFIVIIWCLLLSVILFVSSICIGYLIEIPGWSEQLFLEYFKKFFLITGLTILLGSPVAFIASYSKGIVAPIAFVILMLIMAQFVALAGLGSYFPWAIPGVHSVPKGTPGMEIVTSSYIILLVTCLAGFFGTIAWWRLADQK